MNIFRFELWGMVFISVLGSALHFTFDLFGGSWVAAVFSAVNESTWEHMKLVVVPGILWAIIGYAFSVQSKANNYPIAKAASIYLMPAFIALLFYAYTAILGTNNLVLDILVFIISVVLGQLVSYKIMTKPQFSYNWNKVSVTAILLLVAAFTIFTFSPPENFLFSDPVTGGYGVIK